MDKQELKDKRTWLADQLPELAKRIFALKRGYGYHYSLHKTIGFLLNSVNDYENPYDHTKQLTMEVVFEDLKDQVGKIEQSFKKPYWDNPWKDHVVYVPIDELAECHEHLNMPCGKMDGTSFILTKEKVLEHWSVSGLWLDAYILPQPSGYHSIGIRYGNKGSEYLSPSGNKEKVQALLDKYKS